MIITLSQNPIHQILDAKIHSSTSTNVQNVIHSPSQKLSQLNTNREKVQPVAFHTRLQKSKLLSFQSQTFTYFPQKLREMWKFCMKAVAVLAVTKLISLDVNSPRSIHYLHEHSFLSMTIRSI
jgi:hypothetical protein